MKQTPSKRLWNWKRQLSGNLAPFAVGLPFQTAGLIIMFVQKQIIGYGLAAFVIGVMLSAISINWLAMTGTKSLETEFQIWYSTELKIIAKDRYFVGFTSGHYQSLLDPHEDIGYFYFDGSLIGFFGEKFNVKFSRDEIRNISKSMNPHSLLGLGGFVNIQAESANKKILIRVEIRSESTLLANKKATRALFQKLKSWKEASRQTN